MGQSVCKCCNCTSSQDAKRKSSGIYPTRPLSADCVWTQGSSIPSSIQRKAYYSSNDSDFQSMETSMGEEDTYTKRTRDDAESAEVVTELFSGSSLAGDSIDLPVFARKLRDITVKIGTRTRLIVEIISSSEFTTTWYRNDNQILTNEDYQLIHEGNLYGVEFTCISIQDNGRWTCSAENNKGRVTTSCNIQVIVPKSYKKPVFYEELEAILTEEGTVSLQCKVIGVPTPVLRWFKDGREIRAGDMFALTGNQKEPISLGTYTCEASNCMGKVYSSSGVKVSGRSEMSQHVKEVYSVIPSGQPPIFTQELKNIKIKIGESFVLSCQIAVPPWPKAVKWQNPDEKFVTAEEGRFRDLADGIGGYMLEIINSEECDRGIWKCMATSQDTSVGVSSCEVQLSVPKNYRKPYFVEKLKAVLTEDGLVSFECKVVGYPTPHLRWFKDGSELKAGDIYQLTGVSSLGSYICIAKNCMGEVSSEASLTVDDIKQQLSLEESMLLSSIRRPPKFVKTLVSAEVPINTFFQFTIQVQTPPVPKLSWYRDDHSVKIDDKKYTQTSNNDGVFQLTVANLEFADQAEWKCVATNEFGRTECSCFLKLVIPKYFKKPKFLENLRAILSEDGIVNLECKVIGVPQPVLKWFKDGIELNPGDIHKIMSGQDGTCCLGLYTCEARNCMGSVTSSASVHGIEDTSPPKMKMRKLSLSTINEEDTFRTADDEQSIALDHAHEISYSFDGKEISVSYYDTPDLTHEEAVQIVEMYADQLSEHISEHNVLELPPLRIVKETSTASNILMEGVVIDVLPEYFTVTEEDQRTEADIEDISVIEDHLLSSRTSRSFAEDEPKVQERKPSKPDSVYSPDTYFSLSESRGGSKTGSRRGSRSGSRKSSTPSTPVGRMSAEPDSETFRSAKSSSGIFTPPRFVLFGDTKLYLQDSPDRPPSTATVSFADDAEFYNVPESGTGDDDSSILRHNSQFLIVLLSNNLTDIQQRLCYIEREMYFKTLKDQSPALKTSLDNVGAIIHSIQELRKFFLSLKKIKTEESPYTIENINEIALGLRKSVEQIQDSILDQQNVAVQKNSIKIVYQIGDTLVNVLDLVADVLKLDTFELSASKEISKESKHVLISTIQDIRNELNELVSLTHDMFVEAPETLVLEELETGDGLGTIHDEEVLVFVDSTTLDEILSEHSEFVERKSKIIEITDENEAQLKAERESGIETEKVQQISAEITETFVTGSEKMEEISEYQSPREIVAAEVKKAEGETEENRESYIAKLEDISKKSEFLLSGYDASRRSIHDGRTEAKMVLIGEKKSTIEPDREEYLIGEILQTKENKLIEELRDVQAFKQILDEMSCTKVFEESLEDQFLAKKLKIIEENLKTDLAHAILLHSAMSQSVETPEEKVLIIQHLIQTENEINTQSKQLEILREDIHKKIRVDPDLVSQLPERESKEKILRVVLDMKIDHVHKDVMIQEAIKQFLAEFDELTFQKEEFDQFTKTKQSHELLTATLNRHEEKLKAKISEVFILKQSIEEVSKLRSQEELFSEITTNLSEEQLLAEVLEAKEDTLRFELSTIQQSVEHERSLTMENSEQKALLIEALEEQERILTEELAAVFNQKLLLKDIIESKQTPERNFAQRIDSKAEQFKLELAELHQLKQMFEKMSEDETLEILEEIKKVQGGEIVPLQALENKQKLMKELKNQNDNLSTIADGELEEILREEIKRINAENQSIETVFDLKEDSLKKQLKELQSQMNLLVQMQQRDEDQDIMNDDDLIKENLEVRADILTVEINKINKLKHYLDEISQKIDEEMVGLADEDRPGVEEQRLAEFLTQKEDQLQAAIGEISKEITLLDNRMGHEAKLEEIQEEEERMEEEEQLRQDLSNLQRLKTKLESKREDIVGVMVEEMECQRIILDALHLKEMVVQREINKLNKEIVKDSKAISETGFSFKVVEAHHKNLLTQLHEIQDIKYLVEKIYSENKPSTETISSEKIDSILEIAADELKTKLFEIGDRPKKSKTSEIEFRISTTSTPTLKDNINDVLSEKEEILNVELETIEKSFAKISEMARPVSADIFETKEHELKERLDEIKLQKQILSEIPISEEDVSGQVTHAIDAKEEVLKAQIHQIEDIKEHLVSGEQFAKVLHHAETEEVLQHLLEDKVEKLQLEISDVREQQEDETMLPSRAEEVTNVLQEQINQIETQKALIATIVHNEEKSTELIEEKLNIPALAEVLIEKGKELEFEVHALESLKVLVGREAEKIKVNEEAKDISVEKSSGDNKVLTILEEKQEKLAEELKNDPQNKELRKELEDIQLQKHIIDEILIHDGITTDIPDNQIPEQVIAEKLDVKEEKIKTYAQQVETLVSEIVTNPQDLQKILKTAKVEEILTNIFEEKEQKLNQELSLISLQKQPVETVENVLDRLKDIKTQRSMISSIISSAEETVQPLDSTEKITEILIEQSEKLHEEIAVVEKLKVLVHQEIEDIQRKLDEEHLAKERQDIAASPISLSEVPEIEIKAILDEKEHEILVKLIEEESTNQDSQAKAQLKEIKLQKHLLSEILVESESVASLPDQLVAKEEKIKAEMSTVAEIQEKLDSNLSVITAVYKDQQVEETLKKILHEKEEKLNLEILEVQELKEQHLITAEKAEESEEQLFNKLKNVQVQKCIVLSIPALDEEQLVVAVEEKLTPEYVKEILTEKTQELETKIVAIEALKVLVDSSLREPKVVESEICEELKKVHDSTTEEIKEKLAQVSTQEDLVSLLKNHEVEEVFIQLLNEKEEKLNEKLHKLEAERTTIGSDSRSKLKLTILDNQVEELKNEIAQIEAQKSLVFRITDVSISEEIYEKEKKKINFNFVSEIINEKDETSKKSSESEAVSKVVVQEAVTDLLSQKEEELLSELSDIEETFAKISEVTESGKEMIASVQNLEINEGNLKAKLKEVQRQKQLLAEISEMEESQSASISEEALSSKLDVKEDELKAKLSQLDIVKQSFAEELNKEELTEVLKQNKAEEIIENLLENKEKELNIKIAQLQEQKEESEMVSLLPESHLMMKVDLIEAEEEKLRAELIEIKTHRSFLANVLETHAPEETVDDLNQPKIDTEWVANILTEKTHEIKAEITAIEVLKSMVAEVSFANVSDVSIRSESPISAKIDLDVAAPTEAAAVSVKEELSQAEIFERNISIQNLAAEMIQSSMSDDVSEISGRKTPEQVQIDLNEEMERLETAEVVAHRGKLQVCPEISDQISPEKQVKDISVENVAAEVIQSSLSEDVAEIPDRKTPDQVQIDLNEEMERLETAAVVPHRGKLQLCPEISEIAATSDQLQEISYETPTLALANALVSKEETLRAELSKLNVTIQNLAEEHQVSGSEEASTISGRGSPEQLEALEVHEQLLEAQISTVKSQQQLLADMMELSTKSETPVELQIQSPEVTLAQVLSIKEEKANAELTAINAMIQNLAEESALSTSEDISEISERKTPEQLEALEVKEHLLEAEVSSIKTQKQLLADITELAMKTESISEIKEEDHKFMLATAIDVEEEKLKAQMDEVKSFKHCVEEALVASSEDDAASDAGSTSSVKQILTEKLEEREQEVQAELEEIEAKKLEVIEEKHQKADIIVEEEKLKAVLTEVQVQKQLVAELNEEVPQLLTETLKTNEDAYKSKLIEMKSIKEAISDIVQLETMLTEDIVEIKPEDQPTASAVENETESLPKATLYASKHQIEEKLLSPPLETKTTITPEQLCKANEEILREITDGTVKDISKLSTEEITALATIHEEKLTKNITTINALKQSLAEIFTLPEMEEIDEAIVIKIMSEKLMTKQEQLNTNLDNLKTQQGILENILEDEEQAKKLSASQEEIETATYNVQEEKILTQLKEVDAQKSLLESLDEGEVTSKSLKQVLALSESSLCEKLEKVKALKCNLSEMAAPVKIEVSDVEKPQPQSGKIDITKVKFDNLMIAEIVENEIYDLEEKSEAEIVVEVLNKIEDKLEVDLIVKDWEEDEKTLNEIRKSNAAAQKELFTEVLEVKDGFARQNRNISEPLVELIDIKEEMLALDLVKMVVVKQNIPVLSRLEENDIVTDLIENSRYLHERVKILKHEERRLQNQVAQLQMQFKAKQQQISKSESFELDEIQKQLNAIRTKQILFSEISQMKHAVRRETVQNFDKNTKAQITQIVNQKEEKVKAKLIQINALKKTVTQITNISDLQKERQKRSSTLPSTDEDEPVVVQPKEVPEEKAPSEKILKQLEEKKKLKKEQTGEQRKITEESEHSESDEHENDKSKLTKAIETEEENERKAKAESAKEAQRLKDIHEENEKKTEAEAKARKENEEKEKKLQEEKEQTGLEKLKASEIKELLAEIKEISTKTETPVEFQTQSPEVTLAQVLSIKEEKAIAELTAVNAMIQNIAEESALSTSEDISDISESKTPERLEALEVKEHLLEAAVNSIKTQKQLLADIMELTMKSESTAEIKEEAIDHKFTLATAIDVEEEKLKAQMNEVKSFKHCVEEALVASSEDDAASDAGSTCSMKQILTEKLEEREQEVQAELEDIEAKKLEIIEEKHQKADIIVEEEKLKAVLTEVQVQKQLVAELNEEVPQLLTETLKTNEDAYKSKLIGMKSIKEAISDIVQLETMLTEDIKPEDRPSAVAVEKEIESLARATLEGSKYKVEQNISKQSEEEVSVSTSSKEKVTSEEKASVEDQEDKEKIEAETKLRLETEEQQRAEIEKENEKKRAAEELAKQKEKEREERDRRELEEKEKARRELEEKERKEREDKERQELEEKERQETEKKEKARRKLEEKERKEREEKERQELEEKERQEREEKERRQLEENEKKRREAEEKEKELREQEKKEKARLELEENEKKRRELEEKDRQEQEEKERLEQEKKEKARLEMEEKERKEREEKEKKRQELEEKEKELRKLEEKERQEKEKKEKEKARLEIEEKERIDREEKEKKRRELEEKERRELEEKERKELEEKERQKLEENEKKRREAEEKERQEREEKDKEIRKLEEKEKKEKARLEIEEKERKEHEEKEKKRRELEEKERQELEEKEKQRRELEEKDKKRQELEEKERQEREKKEKERQELEEKEKELRKLEEKERQEKDKKRQELEEKERQELEEKEKELRKLKEKEKKEKARLEVEEKERQELEEKEKKRRELEEKDKKRQELEEKERQEREKKEKERQELEEKEKQRRELEEKDKKRQELEEKERQEREKKEKERQELEEKEKQRRELEEKDKKRQEAEEKERQEREEKERLEQEKKEKARLENEEKERKDREEKEKERRELKEKDKKRQELEERERQEREAKEKELRELEEKELQEREEKERLELEAKELREREEKEKARLELEEKEKERRILEEKEKEQRELEEKEKQRREQEKKEKERKELEEKERKDREDKERRELEEKQRQEREEKEKERRKVEEKEKKRRELEEKEREEKERKEKEEKERREREDKERQEKEKLEREKREQLEKDKRERDEKPKRDKKKRSSLKKEQEVTTQELLAEEKAQETQIKQQELEKAETKRKVKEQEEQEAIQKAAQIENEKKLREQKQRELDELAKQEQETAARKRQERIDKSNAEKQRRERDEEERAARDLKKRQERDRLSKERRDRDEKERQDKEKLQREERERHDKEQKSRAEKLHDEREQQRRAERERLEKDKHERDEKLKRDRERKEREKIEVNEKRKRERLEKQRAEEERFEKEEQKRLERERRKRLERERLEKESHELEDKERAQRMKKWEADKERFAREIKDLEEKERIELEKIRAKREKLKLSKPAEETSKRKYKPPEKDFIKANISRYSKPISKTQDTKPESHPLGPSHDYSLSIPLSMTSRKSKIQTRKVYEDSSESLADIRARLQSTRQAQDRIHTLIRKANETSDNLYAMSSRYSIEPQYTPTKRIMPSCHYKSQVDTQIVPYSRKYREDYTREIDMESQSNRLEHYGKYYGNYLPSIVNQSHYQSIFNRPYSYPRRYEITLFFGLLRSQQRIIRGFDRELYGGFQSKVIKCDASRSVQINAMRFTCDEECHTSRECVHRRQYEPLLNVTKGRLVLGERGYTAIEPIQSSHQSMHWESPDASRYLSGERKTNTSVVKNRTDFVVVRVRPERKEISSLTERSSSSGLAISKYVKPIGFVTRPDSLVSVVPGQDIVFSFEVNGGPNAEVSLTKRSVDITQNRRVYTEINGNQRKFVIKNASFNDMGTYCLTMENQLGSSHAFVTVTVDKNAPYQRTTYYKLLKDQNLPTIGRSRVLASLPRLTDYQSHIADNSLAVYRSASLRGYNTSAPSFYSQPHNIVAESGDSVRFQVSIGGFPSPTISWFKDGVLLKSGPKHRIFEKFNTRILEISSSSPTDVGVYSVVVQNEVGRAAAAARLDLIQIKQRPYHSRIRY